MAINITQKKRKKKITSNRHTKKYSSGNDNHIRSAGIIVFILNSETKQTSILIGRNNKGNLELLHGKRDNNEDIKKSAIRETKEESGNILNIVSFDTMKYVSFEDDNSYRNHKKKCQHISYIIALELTTDDIKKLTENFKKNIKTIESNSKTSNPYLEMDELVILPIKEYDNYDTTKIHSRDVKFLNIIFKNKSKFIPKVATHNIDKIYKYNSNDFLNNTIQYKITEAVRAVSNKATIGGAEEETAPAKEETAPAVNPIASLAAIAAATRQFDLDIKIDFLNEVAKDQEIINANNMNDIITIITEYINKNNKK